MIGATVTIYAAGTTGYGAGATSLASSSTVSGGSFSLTPTCPGGNPQTYVVATGGNGGGGVNSALAMMALTGPCDSLISSSFVTVNELTTAAAEWAMAQFIDSTGSIIGTSSTNLTGLNNAANAAIVNLVVSVGTSTANSGIPAGNLSGLGCPYPPDADSQPLNCDALDRLDTLANVLASCVESSGPAVSPCNTLFSSTLSSMTTLQAAHVMVTNPTANVSTIYGLQGTPAAAPFQPTFASAPADWTLALNFISTGAQLDNPADVALDAAGNVWVANTGGQGVSELIGPNFGTGAKFFNPENADFSDPNPIALDLAGDAWTVNDSELTANGDVSELVAPSWSSDGVSFSNGKADICIPQWLAIDGASDIWVLMPGGGCGDASASVGELESSNYKNNEANFAPAGAALDDPVQIALDGSNNVWVLNSAGSVSELLSPNYGTDASNFAPASALLSDPKAMALDSANNVWVVNPGGSGSISELASPNYGTAGSNYTPAGAKLFYPTSLALDTAGNVFVGICGSSCAGSGAAGSLSELVNPNYGTSGLNFTPAGADFAHRPKAVVVDSAGNVWVPIANTPHTSDDFAGSVTEMVGLASPVLTPTAACIKQGHTLCKP